MSLHGQNKTANKVFLLTIIFLIIELLDETIDGVYSPALPLIRSDLHLDYTQIGMLLTIPNTIGSIIEPILGIWGDIGQRRQLILGGGVAFAGALLLISLSHNFPLFLAALVLFNPASGGFVSLSQATLMDIEPKRHEQNMARWALAGSVGNVIGPVVLAVAVGLTNSWRSAFFILAILTVLLLVMLCKYRQLIPNTPNQSDTNLKNSCDRGIGKIITQQGLIHPKSRTVVHGGNQRQSSAAGNPFGLRHLLYAGEPVHRSGLPSATLAPQDHTVLKIQNPKWYDEPIQGLREGIGNAINALKQRQVLLWLTLLQFSDLMLDILRGFVALYFVDVVGANNTQISLAITIWLGFGLLGDFLLIPLLERVRGLAYLKLSAAIVLFLYPAFLLLPNINIKLLILALLGLFNAGWYSILQGQLYTAMPGQSGTVLTLSNLFGLVGGLMPLVLGLLAQHYGLENTMWLLIAAPIALLIGLLRF
ncbi:MAG: MFS transporter [Calothrix sp. MO_167.B12]|nr:MFS transporter [Calothrix sp. MO_167.B12]